MGLKASPHDPCLISGILDNPSPPQTISEAQSQLPIGLYVDDFVFYSSGPTQEALFETLIQEHTHIDFMGDVDYFRDCVYLAPSKRQKHFFPYIPFNIH